MFEKTTVTVLYNCLNLFEQFDDATSMRLDQCRRILEVHHHSHFLDAIAERVENVLRMSM